MRTESSEVLSDLSVQMWRPPLFDAWRARSLSEPAMTVLLILAFGTDVEMEGLSGFLENSSGEFLPEIIDAFEAIGAIKTAAILRQVRQVMQQHGVTHADLRADFDGVAEYTISSFRETHGEAAAKMSDALQAHERALYIYDRSSEAVYELLEQYAELHLEVLRALLEHHSA